MQPDSQISLPEVVRALYERRIVITLAALLAGIVAGALSYLVKPIFRAEVLVVPSSQEQGAVSTLSAQLGGLADLVGFGGGLQGGRAAAIATLRSRALTEAFIEDHKLLPVIFASRWDKEDNRWKTNDPEKQPTVWDAYREFDKGIRQIQEDRKTGLVTLSIEWTDPVEASDWANELVRRANSKLQQEAILESEKTIAYLQEQLAKAGAVEVRQSLYSLIEAETKKIAVAHAREQFGFKVIDPAVPPKRRVWPARTMMVAVGFFLGLVACSAWVLFRTLIVTGLAKQPG